MCRWKRQQQSSPPDSGRVNRQSASSAEKMSFFFSEALIAAINKHWSNTQNHAEIASAENIRTYQKRTPSAGVAPTAAAANRRFSIKLFDGHPDMVTSVAFPHTLRSLCAVWSCPLEPPILAFLQGFQRCLPSRHHFYLALPAGGSPPPKISALPEKLKSAKTRPAASMALGCGALIRKQPQTSPTKAPATQPSSQRLLTPKENGCVQPTKKKSLLGASHFLIIILHLGSQIQPRRQMWQSAERERAKEDKREWERER